MVIGLGVLVVIGAGAAYWIGHRDSAQAQARVDELLKRNDSLSAKFEKTVGSMKGRVESHDAPLHGADRLLELRAQGIVALEQFVHAGLRLRGIAMADPVRGAGADHD